MTKRKVTKNKKNINKEKSIQNEEGQDQNVNKQNTAFWKTWLTKTLNEDKNFELQEDGLTVKCLYCHETQKLYRKNDGLRLFEHIETLSHKEKYKSFIRAPQKLKNTVLENFFLPSKSSSGTSSRSNSVDIIFVDDKNDEKTKVCHGFFSLKYAALAKYGVANNGYKILRDDNLYIGHERAEGYFQSDACKGKIYPNENYCNSCAKLSPLAELRKHALRMEILIAQIDCLLMLYHGQTIPTNMVTKYQNSLLDDKQVWIKLCKEDLYEVVEQQLLEAIQEHGISDWIAKCTRYMIDKTIHDQKPVFEGMAIAITKILDKMEHGITTT
ncbi:hypothetical protein C1645_832096 [Glomus cerebriforme]|uniref:Uncharacterized protein n=1 Tax=Glomus cerebriforme TaxID=658196 RepID=A0A397SPI1_9GLOM|nr:hypothetical protein C1645_832096 [Glomus cerebriforme]